MHGRRETTEPGDSRTGPWPAWLHRRPAGFAVDVYVQPGARRAAIVGEHAGRLKIAVSAAPVDGRANEAVLELLSTRLGLARRCLTLEAGSGQRSKRIAASASMPPEEVVQRLTPPE